MFRVTIGGETHCVIRGLIRWLVANGGRVLVGGGRISQQGNVVGLGAFQAVAHFHCSVAAVLRGVVDVLPAAAVVVVRPRQLDSEMAIQEHRWVSRVVGQLNSTSSVSQSQTAISQYA